MGGSNTDGVGTVVEEQFLRNLGLKARKWVAITPNVAITEDDLAGIIVHTTGTVVLIDSVGAELDCGTVTGDPLKVYPICPTKLKTGSTAVCYAVYEG